MDKEKYIGLLGLADDTTRHYIKRFNYHFNHKHGAYHTAPLKVLNYNFNLINPYLPNQYDHLKLNLLKGIQLLWQFDVDHIVIPNITLHQTLNLIEKELEDLELLNIWEDVPRLIDTNEYLLFATRHTMGQNPLARLSNAHKLELEYGDEHKIENIRKVIYQKPEDPQALSEFKKLLIKYKNQQIILACTELSIAYQNIDYKETKVIDLVERQILRSLTRITN